MTKMMQKTDKHGRNFRYYKQRTQVTCGPACCLMMWANVFEADPIADEGGVIALSRKHPKAWNPVSGAEISNLSRVMAEMGIPNEVKTITDPRQLRSAFHNRVHRKKPALAFAEWEVASKVVGHFVVVAYADSARDEWTILAPSNGVQATTGIPAYYPYVNGSDDDPVLKFTGAVAFVTA